MQTTNCYHVDAHGAGIRLDTFLAGENSEISRSHIQKLLEDSYITVNGVVVRPSYRLKPGDAIVMTVPPPLEMKLEPENIPLDIYYEDRDVLVVNKPRGMVVHPAEGNYSGTLVNSVLYHCRDLSGINGVLRPGIVHRLDKDTSGLLTVAKNDVAHLDLARQLKDRQVVRRYLALLHGRVKAERGLVDAPIGRDNNNRQKMAVVYRNGKNALTHFEVIKRYQNYTYTRIRLETGRTHQIRVHMNYIAHPVVGDPKYGPSKPHFGLEGQFLHAAVLGFKHPRNGGFLQFEAPLPGVLADVLEHLDNSSGD